ncbi:MAG TPA: four helix bundle protein [Reyranella sp.]|nr:four helix bundle protein [Reyranella sp.]
MALYSDLPIYKHGCDLLSLALDVQTQMPRIFKRSLGDRIHALCVEMLEAMAMANAHRGEERVQQIDKLLSHLRATTAMLRVSHDKRLISPKLWAASIELLDAVGSQAGGWRRQTLGSLSAAPAV